MKTEHLRFIDLSVALENDVPADPPGLQPRINYTDHRRGAEQIAAMFPGLSPDQLPDGGQSGGHVGEADNVSAHDVVHAAGTKRRFLRSRHHPGNVRAPEFPLSFAREHQHGR